MKMDIKQWYVHEYNYMYMLYILILLLNSNHLFKIISHFTIQVILTKLFKIRLIIRQFLFTNVIETYNGNTSFKCTFQHFGLESQAYSGEALPLTVHSFRVIWIRMSHWKSLRSWYIKWTDKSTLVMDLSTHLTDYDQSDLRSLILIQITSNECTLNGTVVQCSFNADYNALQC